VAKDTALSNPRKLYDFQGLTAEVYVDETINFSPLQDRLCLLYIASSIFEVMENGRDPGSNPGTGIWDLNMLGEQVPLHPS
tara:strand:- start:68 stop:310 length:243 start_codon:yes stop_codon:yes gene_type:complete